MNASSPAPRDARASGEQPRLAACASCAEPMLGPYCHACGAAPVRLGLRALGGEVLEEIVGVDGKLARTARALLRPGFLTTEILAGRRALYIAPLRLFLFATLALWFATDEISPEMQGPTLHPLDGDATLGARAVFAAKAFLRARIDHANAHLELFTDQLRAGFAGATFVFLPVFALVSWLLYRKRRPFYVEHVYYALPLFTFLTLLTVLGQLAGRFLLGHVGLTWARIVVLPLVYGGGFAYHYLGARRVFGGSRRETVLKGLALLVATRLGLNLVYEAWWVLHLLVFFRA